MERIIEMYQNLCMQSKIKPRKSIKRSFEDIQTTDQISLIIQGNYKLNFHDRIEDIDSEPLFKSLSPLVMNIELIDLQYNLIGNSGAEYLATLLNDCRRLKSLNLQGNKLLEKGAKVISEALKGNESLMIFNLNDNIIKTEGLMSVTELLFTNTSLSRLDVGNNQIDHDGIIAITSVLNCSNSTLEVLNIDNPRYNFIGQETAIHIAKMLANNSGLKKISLRKHLLRCNGIYIIAEHLLENTILRVLDLNANEIAPEGCSYIGKYLSQESCKLESLYLASNKAVDLGAKAISQAIAKNKSLIHLDFTYNNINDDGLSRLAESLFHNSTLISFKLFGNHFAQEAMGLFKKLFEEKKEKGWADFLVYIVDEHFDMAYVETKLNLDIYV